MRYTGRIGGIIFSFSNSLLGFLLHPQTNLNGLILVTTGNLALCFWLGKKYDEAKFYSEKDPLTFVYNRRYIIKSFPKLLNKVTRNSGKLSLFVIDIDDFKKINDNYGHEIGDSVIRDIVKAFVENTRKEDVIARWGGDEFLVIMPYSDDLYPISLLERVKSGLEDTSTKLGIPVSISIGKSVYPDDAKSLVDLVKFADKNMYELKFQKKQTVGTV